MRAHTHTRAVTERVGARWGWEGGEGSYIKLYEGNLVKEFFYIKRLDKLNIILKTNCTRDNIN